MATEEERVVELEAKQLVVQFIDEIWNNRNLDAVDALCHPICTCTIAGVVEAEDREALKPLFAANHAAFEVDTDDRPRHLITETQNDVVWVVVHRPYGMRHIGEYRGIPPTGQRVVITSTDIFGVFRDQIVEMVVEFDVRGLRQKLRQVSL
jgi:SnoaL-like polyketide cyclase